MRCYVRWLLGVSLTLATAADAQTRPVHAPDGGTYERIVSVFVPPKPGEPFMAIVTAHWTRINADGSKITLQNRRAIVRDRSGRILQERRRFVPSDSGESKISSFDIEDPIKHGRYACNPYKKSCELSDYFVHPDQVEIYAKTARITTVEDTGMSTLSGLEVFGSREITMLAAGTVGNDRDITITKEFWYSPRLGVNLRVKRDDPRFGVQEFVVGDIKLAEPDAKMLKVPDGYRVIDMRSHSAIRP